MHSKKLPALATLLVFLAIAGLHAIRISGLHGWSDDGSAYLRHATNIMQGRPYGETPYRSIGQQLPTPIYPPALALLLIPFIKLWGIDFAVFQTLMFVLFLGALYVSLRALLAYFPFWISLAAVALLGADAVVGALNEHINSDSLALIFVAAVVWLVEGFDWSACSGKSLVWKSLAAAALVLLAIETRSINAVMLAAFPLHSLWRYRRLTLFSILVPIVTVGAMAGVSLVLGSSSPGMYAKYLSLLTPTLIRRNVIHYALSFSDFLGLEPTGWRRGPAFLAMLCALWGGIRLLRLQRPFWMVVAALNMMVLLIWPWADTERFLLPILPLMLACLVYGISELAEWLPQTARPAMRFGLPAIVILSSAYAYWSFPPLENTINSPDTLEMYAAVKQHTSPNSLIALRKPRTLSLFTDLPTAGYSFVEPDTVRREFCEARVTHVVSAPSVFPDDAEFLEPALSKGGFDLLFRNNVFSLYAVKLCDAR